MMKLGPSFSTVGTSWDHQGKSEISQIFISCSRSRIESIQFAYVENGTTVLSDKIGRGCPRLETITLNYPSEYITRVLGCYLDDSGYSRGTNYLCSLTFYTNKGKKYGPYGPGVPFDDFDPIDFEDGIVLNDFDYKIGGKFWGFFGTYKSNGIETIGLYMKPLPLANQSGTSRP